MVHPWDLTMCSCALDNEEKDNPLKCYSHKLLESVRARLVCVHGYITVVGFILCHVCEVTRCCSLTWNVCYFYQENTWHYESTNCVKLLPFENEQLSQSSTSWVRYKHHHHIALLYVHSSGVGKSRYVEGAAWGWWRIPSDLGGKESVNVPYEHTLRNLKHGIWDWGPAGYWARLQFLKKRNILLPYTPVTTRTILPSWCWAKNRIIEERKNKKSYPRHANLDIRNQRRGLRKEMNAPSLWRFV